MSHGFGPGPIRIVLVPGHYTTFFWRLGKQLIMPESHGMVAEQLACSHQESRIPQHIMKIPAYPPGTERMKQDGIVVQRFIEMELIKEFMPGMFRIHECLQFLF